MCPAGPNKRLLFSPLFPFYSFFFCSRSLPFSTFVLPRVAGENMVFAPCSHRKLVDNCGGADFMACLGAKADINAAGT